MRWCFFQRQLRCCFSQIWYPWGIQEASRNSILIWNFEILPNLQKNTKFSNQNRALGSLLEASWVSDLERGTSQLSLEERIISLSCLEKILGFVTYLPSKWVYPPIFRRDIFVVFSPKSGFSRSLYAWRLRFFSKKKIMW